MHVKRNLFFILMLVLIILSFSFVAAADNATSEIGNEIGILAVSDECIVDENFNDNSKLSISENVQDLDVNDSKTLNKNDAQLLGVSNDVEVLGAPGYYVFPSIDGTYETSAIINKMYEFRDSGGTIYLNGQTFTGIGSYEASAGTHVTFKNIKVFGGSPTDSSLMATFKDQDWNDYAIQFRGKTEPIYESNPSGDPSKPWEFRGGFRSTSGCDLINVTFENFQGVKLFNFCSGSLTNCTINNCYSQYQFMGICGCYWDYEPIHVKNCNFTNLHQTYPGANGVNDGSGQLGAVFGVWMENCRFENTSSAQHGGALCIADESEWGSARVPSTLLNCDFINITSRWFAVYIHGNFSSSFAWLKPDAKEIIDGCSFINCTGAGEYSAGVGISHNNVIVRNSNFTNNYGGQGAAIMVGGLSGDHDGFSGRNYEGNNVTIENCTFTNNVATIAGQSSSFCVAVYKKISEGGYVDQPRYRLDGDNYISDPNGDYYLKHDDAWFYPSGDAGAVYVYGDDTKILDCTFDSNIAESGNGSAIYIVGERTIVNGTKFHNHEAVNGTVFIKGNNALIFNSTFINNTADNGACIYIEGNRANINNSTLNNNTAGNGTIYIIGNNAVINDTNLKYNNASYGAGIYIKGNYSKILNSSLDNNTAFDGAGMYISGNNATINGTSLKFNNATNGGGIYIKGNYSIIFNSTLDNNTAFDGAGMYINGNDAVINGTGLKFNNATNGGGIYIHGTISKIIASNFTNNTVTHQGGAVYIDGSYSSFMKNNFINNTAIPHDKDKLSGLGGAIYVKGSNTVSIGNNFEHNSARNGSAFYSNGKNLTIVDDLFKENQAWSYLLIVIADPVESYLNTSDVEIEVIHIGGDNILNAIHSTAAFNETRVKNVTYINSLGDKIVTNATAFQSPVDGVENSKNGTLLYQDNREYFQRLNINVTLANGTVIHPKIRTNSKRGPLGANKNEWTFEGLRTNLYGDVYITIPKEDLQVGEYLVTAEHPEDWNYKYIKNSTKFWVLPHVDLSVVKTCSNVTFFDDDIAVWTITVSNAGNASNATNVVVKDLLPSEFEFVNYTATNGTYNNHTGEWLIPKMANGTSETLIITSIAESFIDRLNNIVHVESDENKIKVSVDRTSDKQIYHTDDVANWTITVSNDGDVDAHDVNLTDLIPIDFEANNYTATKGTYDIGADKWIIGDLPAHTSVTLKISSRSMADDNHITYNIIVDYKEKQLNLVANKTVDKDEYHIGENVICTVTVKNDGCCTATNVVLKDILQPEFKFISASDSRFNPDTNEWTIESLAVGQSETLTINCVAERVEGNVTNYAEISSVEEDWNKHNNIANASARVIPLPHPVKSVENITPYYNDVIEYNLTIVNTGNVTYRNNLTVIDSLPEGLVFNKTVKVINASVVNQTVDGKSVEYVVDGQKITWILTNITGNATIVVKIKVVGLGDKIIRNSTFISKNLTLNASVVKYVGNLTNNLTVVGPNGTNKTVNCTVYPVSIVDLSVNITSDKDEYYVDDIAVWTITVSNAGNGTNATNVTLKDFFPSDKFKFINCTLANGTTFTGDTWYIGNLANGTNVTFTVYSLAIATGTAKHNVTVTCNETEWNYTNNKANKTVNVVPLPYPVKDVSNILPYYHDMIQYNLTIVNTGKGTYTNLLNVTDSLPSGLKFNGTYNVKGAAEVKFVDGGQKLIWTITNITGKNATITLWVKVVEMGDIITDREFIDGLTNNKTITYLGNLTNNVTVTGPNGTNKTTNKTVYPRPLVDLSVNITSDKDEYFVDDIAVWTITVSNAGNGTNATNVALKDLFPSDNFEFINCTSGLNYDKTTGIWTIGNLTNGTKLTFVINSRAIREGKDINHTVSVTCNETEWNYTNNKANKAVDVVILPYPVKTVSNITPYYHDIIQYNLTVVNNGTTIYTGILNVTDCLPDGLVFNGTYKIIGANETSRYVNVNNQTLTWFITNITGKSNATITIYVKVNALGNLITNRTFIDNITNNNKNIKYLGNLTNNLTVTGPNGTKNTTNKTVYPVPVVDLSVNKTSDKPVYFVDDIAVWTIVVSNAGNGTNATNVILKDLVPSQFVVISGTTRNGTFENGIWTIGNLANGTNVTLKIYSRVLDTITSVVNVTNTANVTCNETDWNLTNNEDNATVKLVPLPEPVKAVNNTAPYYNEFIEYYLTVVNVGGVTYVNVLNVTDSLPDGLKFISASVSGADVINQTVGGKSVEYVVDGQKVKWVLTNISKDNATITVKVQVVGLGDNIVTNSTFIANYVTNDPAVKYVGNMTNNVTVTGPNGTNKSDNCTIYPIPIVDLSVNKTTERAVYFADDVVVWTIVVSNAGNGTNATNVTLKDVFPFDEFEFIKCVATNGTEYEANANVWYIGNLANGTNVTLKVYSRAKELGNVVNATNNVTVSCNETDWNLTNNEDNATVKVVPLPEPVKAVNNTAPYYNEFIEYYLTVVNVGGVTYVNVLNVTDSLPDGLKFISASVSGADVINQTVGGKSVEYVVDGQKVKWVLTNISKDNATITVKVQVVGLGDNIVTNSTFIANYVTNDPAVKYVGNMTNNVTVTGPNGTNKSDNETVYPIPIVDVSVNITSDKDEYFVDDIAVWTITVTNAGNGTNATNIDLKELFPSDYFKFINCTDENGKPYDLTEDWIIPFMGNGTDITFTVYSQAVVPGNNINNTAKVNCTEKEWNYINNNATKLVNIVPLPEPVKTVSNIIPYYHEEIEYNLTVVNVGNNNYMDNLTVIDSLPVGLEFLETVKVVGAKVVSETPNGQVITWVLTNVTKGSATITVRVKVNALGNLTNNLTIVGPRGNTTTVNCTVYPKPLVDVSVNITGDKDEYFVDDIAVWTITVSNAGNGTNATNVTLKDLFPSDKFKFINCTLANGTKFTGDTWYIGDLANGTNVTFTVYSRAIATGTAKHNVTVTCNETEWNYTNNNATKAVNVVVLPQPVKTVSNITPYYHDEIEYNLTVVNSGSTDYTNVLTVVDSLPVGLKFMEVVKVIGADVADHSVDGQKVTWKLTNISAGKNATIVVRVKVNALGDLTNNLTITGPNGTNATVNETVYPVPIVDVSVNITSDKDEYFVDDIAVWTITVSNAGNGTNATKINLKELFPSDYFRFINCTDENGEPYDLAEDWIIPFMGNGTDITFTVYSQAVVPGNNINNAAKVNCTEDEWNYTNNNATKLVDVVVLPQPVKVASNNTPYYHDVIEYNLTVVNVGSGNYMDNLTVIDSLPVGLEFLETVNVVGAKVVSETPNGQVITWVLTNITKGSATITVRVNVNALGDLTNNLTVVGPKGTSVTVDETVYPKQLVDVSVNITSDKDEYFVGDVAIWTVTISNAANGTNATNVSLKDLFPNEFEFINCTLPEGTIYDKDTGIWTIGKMANGTTLTLTITSRAIAVKNNIVNEVNATCSENEWNLTNNVDDKLVNVLALPLIEKTVNTTTPYNKEFVEYYLTVKNIADSNYINNLTVIDSLPDGLIFVETIGISGADLIKETADGQKITWIITNISAKSEAVITVKVFVDDIGELTNNLTLVGPNGDNYTVDCTVNPIPITDLEIIKLVSTTIPHKNDIIIWTLIVTNKGVNTAVNTIVTDKLPAGLIYLSDDSLNNYDPESGIWTIGDLASGESITINIETLVDTTNKTIINLADVTSDTYDVNETNNHCNNSTTVPPEADLVLTIEPDVTEVTVGDTVIYTITVKNQGPDSAVNSRATVVIPKELELLGYKPSKGTYDPETGIWTIGDVAPGEEVTLILETEALVSGKIVVKAGVVCDTYESDLSNNNDTAEITVLPKKPQPPVNPENPSKPPVDKVPTMHTTGNPIVMVLLALLAIAGVTLRRKI